MTPFDIIKDLNKGKKQLYKKNPEETKKILSPFLLNRSMSRFCDTMYFAEMVNKVEVPIEALCTYYHHAVSPAYRYRKWVKPHKEEDVEVVANFLQCNLRVAEQYLSLLDDPESVIEELTRGVDQ